MVSSDTARLVTNKSAALISDPVAGQIDRARLQIQSVVPPPEAGLLMLAYLSSPAGRAIRSATSLRAEATMNDFRFNLGRDPIKFRAKPRSHNWTWMAGIAAAVMIIIIGVFAFVYRVG